MEERFLVWSYETLTKLREIVIKLQGRQDEDRHVINRPADIEVKFHGRA